MDREQIRLAILRDIDDGSRDTKLYSRLGISHDLWFEQVGYLVREGYMTSPVFGDDTVYSFVSTELTEKGERLLADNRLALPGKESTGLTQSEMEKLIYAMLKRFSEGVTTQSPRDFGVSSDDFIRATGAIQDLHYVTRVTLTKEPIMFLNNSILTTQGKQFLDDHNKFRQVWNGIVSLARFIRG